MKKLIQILILFACLGGLATAGLPKLTTKAVEFTVLDSDKVPISDAFIEASRVGPENAEGHTNKEGKLTLSLNEGANLTVYVSKNGFYRTGGRLFDGGMYKGPRGRLVARALADQYTIILKEIRNPTHLRHKQFRGRAPSIDQPLGYDLHVGDWTAPYGKGVTADLYFHFREISVEESAYRGILDISFPEPGDGIQPFEAARPFSMEFGSDLAPPHEAPTDGYLPQLSWTKGHVEGEPYHDSSTPGRNYLFRTRTRLDEKGRILQACYGWIQGEIEFDPRDPKGPQLAFSYFFNPDPDPDERRLEYNLHVPRSPKP